MWKRIGREMRSLEKKIKTRGNKNLGQDSILTEKKKRNTKYEIRCTAVHRGSRPASSSSSLISKRLFYLFFPIYQMYLQNIHCKKNIK